MESKTLTYQKQHACKPTGVKRAYDTSCFKNIAIAQVIKPQHVVKKVGNLYMPVHTSPEVQKTTTHQQKEKIYQYLGVSITQSYLC